MSELHQRLGVALGELEHTLKTLNLWQADTPNEAALASQQPFCIDTLSFPQWLQFVFLPRMGALVDAKLALPGACGIAPMAEEAVKPLALDARALIAQLEHIDRILTQA